MQTIRINEVQSDLRPSCEFCGSSVHVVAVIRGKPYLRCDSCGHDQVAVP